MAMKTMHCGRLIAPGDAAFLLASENEVCAQERIFGTEPPRRIDDVAGQILRVSVAPRRTAFADRPLTRRELKTFRNWDDDWLESELIFKFYRHAPDKIVDVSAEAAGWLRGRRALISGRA